MKITAYARYSTDRQKKTSIDDQLLVCDSLAEMAGGTVDPDLILVDRARSGGVKDKDNRPAFEALQRAIMNRDADVVVVDEVSRLARNAAQLGQFEQLIEESGVRLLSGDGVDSAIEGWQLLFQLRGMINAQSLRTTRHWTGRSMLGRLERGFMIATPPFGYTLKRVFNEAGEKQGALWLINDREAPIVKELFERRRQGEPLGAIAKWMNESGIPTPRKGRKNRPSYWRPASIDRLLRNSIYRGVFVWHGSYNVIAKAKKQKRKPGIREFDRPQLRIVDDETWFACNKKRISRTGRGGGKHPFAGLVRCGTCHSILTVCTGGSVPTLYCAQCQQARRVAAVKRERGGYLSVTGLQEVLIAATRHLLSPSVISAFKERLEERLTGGHDDEIARLKAELDHINRGRERLANLIRHVEDDDGQLDAEYREANADRTKVLKKLSELESGKAAVDKQAIKKQLAMDPTKLLDKLFDSDLPAPRLRALFCQIFDEIILECKPERHVAIIRVTYSPGAVAATITGTDPVDTRQTTLRFKLSIQSLNPTVWKVELLAPQSATTAVESVDETTAEPA